MPYTDETLLNFGVHKGKKLANIPSSWFLWYEEAKFEKNPALMDYIKDNKQALLQEVDLIKIKDGSSF